MYFPFVNYKRKNGLLLVLLCLVILFVFCSCNDVSDNVSRQENNSPSAEGFTYISPSELEGDVQKALEKGLTNFKLREGIQVELPEELTRQAVPTERVHDGQKMLEDYQALREMISLTRKPDNQPNHDAPQLNEPFPKFSAKDIDGKTWNNEAVKGKPMVINLWYSGCGPCLREMPELSTWKEMFPDVMFFSATFHDAATTRRITEQRQFTWTHLVNEKEMMKWIDGKGFPLTIVVDKDGIVRHLDHGTNKQKRQAIVDCIRQQ